MGMHHGVLLFALLHILKTLPDLFEGLEHINQANNGDETGFPADRES
ncbi:MAG: hypothetical protein ABW127_18275 [Candidatus Thiodiazotropha endolucinida]